MTRIVATAAVIPTPARAGNARPAASSGTHEFAEHLRALKPVAHHVASPAAHAAAPTTPATPIAILPPTFAIATDPATIALTTNSDDGDDPSIAAAAPPPSPAPSSPPHAGLERAPALTPLEQSVHDLLSAIGGDAASADDDHTATDDDTAAPLPPPPPNPLAPSLVPIAPHADPVPTARPAVAPAAAIAPAPPTVELASASHVHLVLDDGAQRIVMTVAVRGTEVNVALRSSDDHTAAALARNAGSLEQAMRGRGLELGQLASEHDRDPAHTPRQHHPDHPDHSDHSDRSPRERAHDPTTDEPFELEEQP